MTGSTTTPSGAPAFGVFSEIGKLRKVLVHRPDLSLRRLTPVLAASEYTVGLSLFEEVRAALDGMKPNQLAEHLVGGLTVAESGLELGRPRRSSHRRLSTPHVVRGLVVAVASLVFAVLFVWYSRNTGHSRWVCWAPFFMAGAALLLGVPVYQTVRPRSSVIDG